MTFAVLLPMKERELSFVYGEDYFAAGGICLLIALGLGLAAWGLQIKLKSPALSEWSWRLLYSGIALLVLGFILDALNPGLRVS